MPDDPTEALSSDPRDAAGATLVPPAPVAPEAARPVPAEPPAPDDPRDRPSESATGRTPPGERIPGPPAASGWEAWDSGADGGAARKRRGRGSGGGRNRRKPGTGGPAGTDAEAPDD